MIYDWVFISSCYCDVNIYFHVPSSISYAKQHANVIFSKQFCSFCLIWAVTHVASHYIPHEGEIVGLSDDISLTFLSGMVVELLLNVSVCM